MKIDLSAIRVNGRARKQLGDLAGLASSIAGVGLLHPVVVDSDYGLIAGRRRIEAVRLLGWSSVPVTVARNLDDALSAMVAERDENTCRLDLTPSEQVAMAARLEPLERKAAKERKREGQKQGGKTAGRGRRKLGGNFPPSKSKCRDKVARAVGVSSPTLRRAAEIVQAAKDDPAFAPLVAEMDRTRRVNGVYRKLKVARQSARLDRKPAPLPDGPFDVLVIDPPWHYDKRAADSSHRSALPYPSMKMDRIIALAPANRAATDCVLWLWATNAHLRAAFEVVEAWGFAYKTLLTWVKPKIGTGDWLRGQTEHCLLCVRGRPTVRLTNQSTVIHGASGRHSEKPNEFYAMVEKLCPGSKLEMFQRTPRKGWTGHGDECGA